MRTALRDMLGAVRFTPGQLDKELSWLDAVTHGRPYGVDVLIPTRLAGRDEGLSAGETAARVPAEHVELARDLLLRYGVISKVEHARRQAAAGVDLIVAQGHEAGGHTGEITTMRSRVRTGKRGLAGGVPPAVLLHRPVNSRKDVNDGSAAQSGHRRNIRVPIPE
jgi:Nitronate monooxygenase